MQVIRETAWTAGSPFEEDDYSIYLETENMATCCKGTNERTVVGTQTKTEQYATSAWLSLGKPSRKNRSITLTVNFILFLVMR